MAETGDLIRLADLSVTPAAVRSVGEPVVALPDAERQFYPDALAPGLLDDLLYDRVDGGDAFGDALAWTAGGDGRAAGPGFLISFDAENAAFHTSQHPDGWRDTILNVEVSVRPVRIADPVFRLMD